MKKIITNSYITNRNKPKNLNPDDEKLFINEFTKKIEDTAIYFYKNISYSNNILYKYKFFSVDLESIKWIQKIGINIKKQLKA